MRLNVPYFIILTWRIYLLRGKLWRWKGLKNPAHFFIAIAEPVSSQIIVLLYNFNIQQVSAQDIITVFQAKSILLSSFLHDVVLNFSRKISDSWTSSSYRET
jgi:hypothetical protein